MVGSGIKKLILNLQKVSGTNVSLIKLIITIIQSCQKANIRVRVVGTSGLSAELKEFQEIDLSIDDAKGQF